MSTINKAIFDEINYEPAPCKLRKDISICSKESTFTHNTTDNTSRKNSVECMSFFDEEKSEVQSNYSNMSSDLKSQTDEEVSDIWEVSSICTDNSNDKCKKVLKYLHIMSPPDNWQDAIPNRVWSCFGQILSQRGPKGAEGKGGMIADYVISTSECQLSGKCIASNVRGQGSTGTSSKQLQKLIKAESKLLSSDINNDNSSKNSSDSSFTQQQQQRQRQRQLSQQQHQEHHEEHYEEHHEETTIVRTTDTTTMTSSLDKSASITSRVMLSFMLMEQEVNKAAYLRAKEFLRKFNPSEEGYKQILEMVQETYRIVLLPDNALVRLVRVLDQEQKQMQAMNAYEKLNLKGNRHPLAAKAGEKIHRFFGY